MIFAVYGSVDVDVSHREMRRGGLVGCRAGFLVQLPVASSILPPAFLQSPSRWSAIVLSLFRLRPQNLRPMMFFCRVAHEVRIFRGCFPFQ